MAPHAVSRVPQLVLIASLTWFAWLAMQAFHELGHVVGAALTGGTVRRVVLHPLTVSRTDVLPNPQPLVVTASGPVLGALLPLVVLGLASLARSPGRHFYRFVAAFCLVANGLYMGVGSTWGLMDAGDILRHGAARWHLVLFGLAATGVGVWLSRGLGPSLGFGEARGAVRRSDVIVAVVLAMAATAVMAFVGARS